MARKCVTPAAGDTPRHPSFRWDDERWGFRLDDEEGRIEELDPGSGEARPVLSLSKGRDDDEVGTPTSETIAC
jgi:hypothetical protein